MSRFLPVLLLLVTAAASTPQFAQAQVQFSLYQGILESKRPKIVKVPRGGRLTCNVNTNFSAYFRLDRMPTGNKVVASFSNGLVLQGKIKKGKVTAKGKVGSDKYTLTIKDSGESSAKASIFVEQTVTPGYICGYPFAGSLYREDVLVAK